MENAARTHWRAAAWLLERTRPEEYARKPANTARDFQVEAALGMLLEAALAATAPAERLAFYQQVQPVCNQALQYCFPQLGPGGNLKKSKLPQTPLANEVSNEALRANIAAHHQQAQAAAANGERVSEWFTVPSPYDEPAAHLSPKTTNATRSDATSNRPATAPAGANPAPSRSPVPDHGSPTPRMSPKTSDATPAVDYNLPIDFNLNFDNFAAAIGVLDQNEQDLLWDQRIRHHAALRRRKERQAAKKEKAVKKRAANSRRRNAA